MQPSPRAETSRLLFPSLRFCIFCTPVCVKGRAIQESADRPSPRHTLRGYPALPKTAGRGEANKATLPGTPLPVVGRGAGGEGLSAVGTLNELCPVVVNPL